VILLDMSGAHNVEIMKNIFYLALCLFILNLAGCYTPVIEGAQQGYDGARRSELQDKAMTGDAAAEYEFGNSYCCKGAGPLKEASIYDNNKATYWYCKSAWQGYAPAQLQLAKIYSGSPIRGLHLVLRASDIVGNDSVNLALAQMWAELAAQGGDEDAADLRDAIIQKTTSKEHQRTEAYLKNWQNAPCRWSSVFPKET
jgi:TPR repeat protein